MTYHVLYIRHAKDMQKRTYVPHQCRTQVDSGAGTLGFCCYDSCKTFQCDLSSGLPLFGIGIKELSTIRGSRRKSSANRAHPYGTDPSPANTSSVTRSIVKRLRGHCPNRRTGQGEGPWVKRAQIFVSYFPINQTVSICRSYGKHTNYLFRQRRQMRSLRS